MTYKRRQGLAIVDAKKGILAERDFNTFVIHALCVWSIDLTLSTTISGE